MVLLIDKISLKRSCTGIIILFIPSAMMSHHDPTIPFKGHIGKYLEQTTQSWTERSKATEEALNVVFIILNEVGFGATSAFGGLIETQYFIELANNGLRYTNCHTTGICSSTRAALLTGRNSQLNAAGTESLYINGEKVAEKSIVKGESTNVGGYDEGFDIGKDQVRAVSDRYSTPYAFNEKLNNITIDLK